MKTKGIVTLCAVVLVCAFCLGFAVPVVIPTLSADAIETDRDLVVGYLITREHLDLYDHDAWLEDNIGDIIAGKYESPSIDADDLAFSGMNSPYAGRLYAELVKRPLYDENGKEAGYTHEYVFPGIEGINFFTALVTDGEESYMTTVSDTAVSDSNAHFKTTDEGEERILEGTLYVAAVGDGEDSGETVQLPDGSVMARVPEGAHVVYLNPVCQSADGAVYVQTGFGYSWSGSRAEGGVYTNTIRGETTVTVNGERTVNRTETTLHVAVVNAPERITLTQMDTQNQPLSVTEYAPGTLPQSLTIGKDTAYLIVETVSRGAEGEKTDRVIVDREEKSMSTFVAEDGICRKQFTQLNWE